MSELELLPLMTGMAKDIGEIRGLLVSHSAVLTKHVADDTTIQTAIAGRLQTLELEQAKSIGASKTWSRISHALTAIIGGSGGALLHWAMKR